MSGTIQKAYVRDTETGIVYVQVPDDSPWEFSLCSGDQSWPGGFGCCREWEVVDPSEVSDEDKNLLGELDDWD